LSPNFFGENVSKIITSASDSRWQASTARHVSWPYLIISVTSVGARGQMCNKNFILIKKIFLFLFLFFIKAKKERWCVTSYLRQGKPIWRKLNFFFFFLKITFIRWFASSMQINKRENTLLIINMLSSRAEERIKFVQLIIIMLNV
jgi:hypothetical protein